ncbi:unnamed protein product [Bursaphelenchus okinawaensis]|uniref:Uncharacterized protein n=1 Tax=Bursaphelenchus okinawaensis TaxID=465554 RepID=A0A811KU29_9BILA|nr:unnamed protein product [Bursaphelenchus okinawaensis]CAG9112204.1 unnamed protein product [Bursaphelenchus okinawaensis]
MGYKMCDLYRLLRVSNIDLLQYMLLSAKLKKKDEIGSEAHHTTEMTAVYHADDSVILEEVLEVIQHEAKKSHVNLNLLPIQDESEHLSTSEVAQLTKYNNIIYLTFDEQVDLDRLLHVIPSTSKLTLITLNEEKLEDVGGQKYCSQILAAVNNSSSEFESFNRIQINVNIAKENVKNGIESFELFSAHDIYIGEEDSARVSYIELGVDSDAIVKQKNSGMFIRLEQDNKNVSMSHEHQIHEPNYVSPTQVLHLLETLKDMGYDYTSSNQEMDKENMVNEEMESDDSKVDKDDNVKASCSSMLDDSRDLATKFNEAIQKKNSDNGLHYRLREPIFNNTFREIKPFGVFKNMFIRSKCTHGIVIVDGFKEFKFNNGDEVTLSMNQDLRIQRVYL